MNRNRLSAVLLTCCIALTGQLQAVSTVYAAEDRILTPLYTAEQETTSALALRVEADTEFSMMLYQHSQEREALAMYTIAETPAEDTTYHCIMLEPGDYTLEVSVPAIQGCTRLLTQKLQFTIIAPDYATDYSASKIEVALLHTIDDTREIGFSDAALTTNTENNTQYLQTDFICNSATGLLGDADLDNSISTQDALVTLQAYIRSLMNPSAPSLSMQQEICADIDGDEVLSANDALAILQYYTQSLMGHSPSWDSLI